MTVVGIGWAFGWPADLARGPRRRHGQQLDQQRPAEFVASLFGAMTIPVLLIIIHGAVAGSIQCAYSAPLCFLAGGIRLERWLGSIVSGVIASAVLVAGWAFEYGSASLFQGPIARASNGVDLSWLASIAFGGSAYWLLSLSDRAIARPVRH